LGELAIIHRPRGNDWLADDISALAGQGVSTIVSLLGRDEDEELGLLDEARICAAFGIAFVALPVPDLAAPSDADAFVHLARRLAERLRGGAHVAIHCRQSVGRSGMLAVSVAVACRLTLQAAIEIVSAARGVAVPETDAQREWLRRNTIQLSADIH